jgi:hypothetical protein
MNSLGRSAEGVAPVQGSARKVAAARADALTTGAAVGRATHCAAKVAYRRVRFSSLHDRLLRAGRFSRVDATQIGIAGVQFSQDRFARLQILSVLSSSLSSHFNPSFME